MIDLNDLVRSREYHRRKLAELEESTKLLQQNLIVDTTNVCKKYGITFASLIDILSDYTPANRKEQGLGLNRDIVYKDPLTGITYCGVGRVPRHFLDNLDKVEQWLLPGKEHSMRMLKLLGKTVPEENTNIASPPGQTLEQLTTAKDTAETWNRLFASGNLQILKERFTNNQNFDDISKYLDQKTLLYLLNL